MQYAIIGAGNVGAALARHFARSGIPVGIANTRGPDTLATLAEEMGAAVVPLTLNDALDADVVILAVPFRAHAAIAAARPDWSGKIIVDAMNAYGIAPQELGGQPSSMAVAAAFSGAKVVKTLNQLPAKLLAQDPVVDNGRRVMFVSGADPQAEASIAQLVAGLGFAPVKLGAPDAGGKLLDMGGPLLLLNLVKQS